MKNVFRENQRLLSILVFILISFSLYAQGQKGSEANSLPISTPEAEGVSSAGILHFLDAVEKGNNELHSFVIVRHGKIISEGWWDPYGRDIKHVMYSVSKSFTSTGVGLAIAENKLKLSDKVVSFFMPSVPDTLDTYMKEMTVQDLLKMSTGMNTDPIFTSRGSTNWPMSFISSPVENKPGTLFKYNNMATFMLSAIVQKATGEKLLDYLKPRLFEPLGFRNYVWDDAPGGYTFGAIGLKIQSDDMAKFGQMLLQKGKWNGRQLVPAAWVEEATSFQIASNAPENKTPKELNDWEQGYGYQFWRCRTNSYRADGLGGQFIIVLPEKDAVVVLTAAAANTQEELNLVWDHLLPAMRDKALPPDKKANAELAKRISSLSTNKTSSVAAPALFGKISGKRIEVEANEIDVKAFSITSRGKEADIQVELGDGKYQLIAGLDHWKFSESKLFTLAAPPRPAQALPIKVASTYTWKDATTLEFTSRFVEESIRSESWTIRFEEVGSQLKVHIDAKVFIEFMGIKSRTLEGSVVE
jgi:CubicO group peptidase (beta-lactamase class C family)